MFLQTVQTSFFFSLALAISCLFDDIHSNWCEVISHWGFDLHFADISNVEHLSPTCPFECPIWKMSMLFLCPFLKRVNIKLHRIDLTDIYGIFHPTAAEYIFSSAHGALSRIDHIVSPKTNLKFKKLKLYRFFFWPQ